MNIASKIRPSFPSLNRLYKGEPLIYMDGPGGTQIPEQVIAAIGDYYKTSNTNVHGFFPTSAETDEVIANSRLAMSDFLGAEGPQTISFGQNMTTLNYSLSRAFSRYLTPGDEVLITQLDHEGNRGPWLTLEESGIIIKEVKLLDDGILDYKDLEEKINEKTKVVALGMASNAIGTINDIKRVREVSNRVGAWLALDAVHYAPHFSIDVQEINCDFLFCSAYKFYGPHVGILYSRPGLLDILEPDRLRTQEQVAPNKIETGTLNHAALTGVSAAVDFIASLGEGTTRRERLINSMQKLSEHERDLAISLKKGFESISGVRIIGVGFESGLRAPTISITVDGLRPEELCKRLGESGICAWDGHFYAIRAIEVLGLLEKGGVTRFGISAYTTMEEVETVVKKVREIVG